MPTGTKIAAIVAVVLLAAAGLYYAFVAPSAPNTRGGQTASSGTANGLSSQTPATLAPAPVPTIPTVGAPPSPASSTPAIGTLGQGPTPTGLPAGTGAATSREQPGFAPGSLTSSGSGKGDSAPSGPGSSGLSAGSTARPATAPAPTGATVNGFPVGSGAPAATPTSPRTTPDMGSPRPTQLGPSGTVPTAPIATGGGNSTDPSVAPVTTPRTGGETTHTVASGETLSSIAKRYLGSENAWRTIAKANPTVDPTSMKIGTKLKIPARDATAAGSAPTTATSSGSPRTTTASSGQSGDVHTVASGDTLASIARRYYGNSKHWQRIYEANRGVIGSDPAALKIGQKLTLPAKTVVVGGQNVER